MLNRLILLLFIAIGGAVGQGPAEQIPLAGQNQVIANRQTLQTRPNVLAVNDQLVISAKDVDGLTEKPIRIDADGTITLPLLGKMHAEGLTVEEFQKALTDQLSAYIRSPQVSVRRLTTRADTVVVSGAFKSPGVYPLQEQRNLLEIISAVGGLQPNVRSVRITRQLGKGHRELPTAINDTAAGVSTATVNLDRLSGNPVLRDQFVIEPDDVLFASPAGPVYVTGQVLKPGAIDVGEANSLGVMELISMAGGLDKDAAPEKMMILRPILNGTRRAEIPVNLKNIQNGELADFRVMPNDMVVVPRAGGKARAVGKVVLLMTPALAGILIYTALR